MAETIKSIGTGAGRDYADFTTAEAQINNDCASAGDHLIWETYNDGLITDNPVTIANLTKPGTSGQFTIRAAAGQFNGRPGEGVRLQAGANGIMLYSAWDAGHVPTVTIGDLEMIGTAVSSGFDIGVLVVRDEAGSPLTLRNLLLHGWPLSGTGFVLGILVNASVANEVNRITNCAVYDIANTGSGQPEAFGLQGQKTVCYNCLAYGIHGTVKGLGFNQSTAVANFPALFNCIGIDCDNASASGTFATSSNNADDDGAMPGTSNVTPVTKTIWTDADNGKFWLPSGSSVIGAGVDKSGVFADDIMGRTRRAWDIGPYAWPLPIGSLGSRPGGARMGDSGLRIADRPALARGRIA